MHTTELFPNSEIKVGSHCLTHPNPRATDWLVVAPWDEVLWLLLFEQHTCSNFQPSDMVETICVSSSS